MQWLQQSINFYYEALKTAKMLWFPVLRQWIQAGLCIWTPTGGLQLPVHPSGMGSSQLKEDHRPKRPTMTGKSRLTKINFINFFIKITS